MSVPRWQKRRPKTGDAREALWLQQRGFDGLYHPDPAIGCGCFLGDLRPCGEHETPCRGGRTVGRGVFKPSNLPEPPV